MKHQATHCAETGADPDDFVDARLFDDMIAQAQAALKTLTPDEVNGWSGKDLDFLVGPFHAVTTYDIAHAGRAAWKARLRGQAAHSAGLDHCVMKRRNTSRAPTGHELPDAKERPVAVVT